MSSEVCQRFNVSRSNEDALAQETEKRSMTGRDMLEPKGIKCDKQSDQPRPVLLTGRQDDNKQSLALATWKSLGTGTGIASEQW